jgi:zinc protease
VAATFGALPARKSAEPAPIPARFHAPGETVETHHGRADQAAVLVAYPAPDFIADPQKARAAIIMESVLENRLLDQVRVAEGSTYSPTGYAAPSEVYPGFGYAVNMVETPPDRVERFRETVRKLGDALKAEAPSADEVLRAVKPRQEQIRKSQQSNEYWLVRLDGASEDPRRLDLIRTSLSGYATITPADVQAAAKTWLDPQKAWTLVIKPADKK